ncbi:MAG: PIN domain-containing protein [Candidatus Dormibacteraceae bacterium]
MASPRVLLADTSAWHRSRHPEIAAEWRRVLNDDMVATTVPIRLEVLYSAQSAGDYDAISHELDALHQLPCDAPALIRALEVQRLLAHSRPLHHRVAIPDLIIAAVAELSGAAVWHYDRDFDRIAALTGQEVIWIASPGSL